MIVSKALKDDLVKQVKRLEADLRTQAEAVTDVHDQLRAEYRTAFDRKRTAEDWTTWLEGRVTQTAAAWVLGTVFVRFCEDNGLLEQHYITGPSYEDAMLAEEGHEEYFRSGTIDLTDRGWLLSAFTELGRSPAGKLLFDPKHNALFQIPISHDAARELIAFWRARDVSGALVHSFVSDDWDTRFLGDLYQDLSESARKKYALLQTPDFVEEFILDLTLTPAIRDFGGHDVIKMIDPTCGSGHFVLGTFHRLLSEWRMHNPMLDRTEHVRLALGQVHGVDINPFAVAIARFRLLIAAMRAAGFARLVDLEQHDLGPLNLAIGDALLDYSTRRIEGIDSDAVVREFSYSTEDISDNFPGILDRGSYHVVVGNPPYIRPRDKAAIGEYRKNFSKSCAGAYTLSVPFAQLFFELAIRSGFEKPTAGFVGQITSNSFMKQNFGAKLIEGFLRDEVELTAIIDVSGVYIPGNGTPSVMLFGRSRDWRMQRNPVVRTVMGIRGEPGQPPQPRDGIVWKAIRAQFDRPGSESPWVSVADLPRNNFSSHPWGLAGGGAGDLKSSIEASSGHTLSSRASFGTSAVPREHEAYAVGGAALARAQIDSTRRKILLGGESLRDWGFIDDEMALWPYDEDSLEPFASDQTIKFLWPYRTPLSGRMVFGETQLERGLPWTAYSMFFKARFGGLGIAFPVVATYNNFSLDRSNRVFKQSAPVLKLHEGATEDGYLELLGILNSSTACFWMQQVCHNKGEGGGARVDAGYAAMGSEAWKNCFEFTGSKLSDFPLPERLPLEHGRHLDQLAQQLAFWSPAALAERALLSRFALNEAREAWPGLRRKMIAAQEELDWEVYGLYGLTEELLTAPEGSVPELKLGERAFEIVLARKMSRGEAETQWFTRHGSTPITDLPEGWAAEYRSVVERRIALIESDRNIGLIERPECKRRWATEGFEALQQKALRSWLLDQFEERKLWFHEVDGVEQPRLLTIAQLADVLRRDEGVVSVAELYAPGKDLARVVAELVDSEHVPYLAALRYKPAGLRKRAAWEDVWDKQRQEDAAEIAQDALKIRDSIPAPPKYAGSDFLKLSYWKNRGKLDVPKERFISYPYAGKDGAATAKDGTLLLGWAGFDHRQQGQALAALIVEREQDDGWDAARLTPLLAGLREVLPWVRQWHGEFDPNYGTSPAEAYEGFLAQTAAQFNLTDEDLVSWAPPATGRGRAKK